MDPGLEKILKGMGWVTGLHLPVANNENKALQVEVEEFMIRKAKATQLYEAEDTRFNSISNHLKFVKRQNQENQNLLATYRQHLDTQHHKFLLTRSEKQRVCQEVRQMDKTIEEIDVRNESKRGDLSRGMLKIDKMKLEANWDNEALKAWEESLKKRDEDNELLKKFSKEDEKKAKELEAKRQINQTDLIARRETLEKVVADVTSYEQILDRTGKMFKQQKQERAALTKQWQEAAKNLRRRDENLGEMVKEIMNVHILVQEEQERLDEQNVFYNNEINNNKEVENQIAELNFENSKLRKDLNELTDYVLILYGEANTLKRQLVTTANFLEKERTKSKEIQIDIESKIFKTSQTRDMLITLQQKLDDVTNTSMSAADRAKQLEQIIELEQRQTRVLDMDVERIQGVYFRTQQSLNEQNDIAKLKEMEINGCEVSMNLLKKQLKEAFNELQRQKEINYDMDYRINRKESKLDSLGGQVIDEDKEAREDKIAELEEVLSNETEVKRLLQAQVTQVEEEMRRLTAAIQADNKQCETLKSKLQDEVLSFEGGSKQVTAAKHSAQQKQVEENVLRLRVNQLDTTMKREDNNIFSLQKYKLELETAMRQRLIEINSSRDILLAKRRNLLEEKGRLRKDIMGRHIKIDQLQKRLAQAVASLGKDESGEPLSVTHFKIKNAQEKYMLQQEGDELDIKVKKAEQGIIAMENTLRVVNTSNYTYKKSLSAVEDCDEEAQEMEELNSAIQEVTNQMRLKKKELSQKKSQLRELKIQLEEIDKEREEVREAVAVVENELIDLKRHQLDHRTRIDRADRHLQASMKNLDITVSQKYRKNLIIRELQDANKSALHQLSQASLKFKDLSEHIRHYCKENDLALPGQRVQHTPSISSTPSTRSSDYYDAGPYVTSVLLSFDTKSEGGHTSGLTRKAYRKARNAYNVYNKD